MVLFTTPSSAEAFILNNGKKIEIVKSKNDYFIENSQDVALFGDFSQAVYTKNGDIVYVEGNGNEAHIAFLGNWKKSKDPQEFIEARLKDLDEK